MSKRYIVAVTVAVVALVAAVIYGVTRTGGTSEQSRSENSQKHYVALGDSVAAGVGLPTYSDASACDRTNQSYPARLAKQDGYVLTNLSCSGATVAAGIRGGQVVNDLALDPQLDRLFSQPQTPALITITVGANDIDWTQFLACYASDCPASLRDQLAPRYAQLQSSLITMFDSMKQHYGTATPTVVVTGYYRLFTDNAKSCNDTAGLDVTEKPLLADLFKGLDTTIRDASSSYNFVTFASIDFSGHGFCTKQPWIQGLDAKAPFHPTEAGQSAIAKQVSRVIKLK